MATREQLESRLSALKAELVAAEGTPTEVYSRIVGYYRSVRNWNAGKRAEFSKRREYGFPGMQAMSPAPSKALKAGALAGSTTYATAFAAPAAGPAVDPAAGGDAASYLLFSRTACPNCPPVKDYLSLSGLPGVVVDVDTDEGLELARRYEVLSTPTAIMLGSDGSQLLRAQTRKQLEPLVRPRATEAVRV